MSQSLAEHARPETGRNESSAPHPRRYLAFLIADGL